MSLGVRFPRFHRACHRIEEGLVLLEKPSAVFEVYENRAKTAQSTTRQKSALPVHTVKNKHKYMNQSENIRNDEAKATGS